MEIISFILVSFLAFLSTMIGSIAGAGGGFIFTPMLILLGFSPLESVSTGLALVLANSLSASYAYYKQGRISLKKTIPLGILTLPGSISGAYLLSSLNIKIFERIFGFFLIIMSIYLIINSLNKGHFSQELFNGRTLGEKNIKRAYFLTPLTGLFSGMFGIGGGILLSPTLIQIAMIPPHIATAISQFITVFSASFSLSYLILTKSVIINATLFVVISGVFGGLIGALVSKKLKARTIVLTTAIVMIMAATIILFRSL